MDRRDLLEAIRQLPGAVAGALGAFIRSLQDNLSMGLLAVALSTLIWVVITNEQNPPRTGIFPTRVLVHAVNVPPNLEVLGPIDPVVLRITAPTDLWAGLTEGGFEATVDLGEQAEGEVRAPVRVHPRDGRVRVLDVVPAEVTVQLDAAKSQVVPVRVNMQQGPPVGFSSEEPRTELKQVTVYGPERQVSLVDAAVADVNLSGARSSLRQSYPLFARTARGYDITGVRLEPQNVVVEVNITRYINYVTLPVLPDVRGTPPAGYWVSRTRVDPAVITAVGPQDVLSSIGVVRTAAIDIGNQTASFTRSVGLELPQGVTLIDRNNVQVEVTILPEQGAVPFRLGPQITGLGSGLQAQLEPNVVEVVVRGEGPGLRELTLDRVGLFANLAGRGVGTHTIDLEVRLPAGFQALRITPSQVRVTITR